MSREISRIIVRIAGCIGGISLIALGVFSLVLSPSSSIGAGLVIGFGLALVAISSGLADWLFDLWD